MCIDSLKYPECNGLAPCCHFWPVQLYYILLYYLTNGTILEKQVIECKMCILTFATKFA